MNEPLPEALVVEGRSAEGIGLLCTPCYRLVAKHWQAERASQASKPLLRSQPNTLPPANAGRAMPHRASEVADLARSAGTEALPCRTRADAGVCQPDGDTIYTRLTVTRPQRHL